MALFDDALTWIAHGSTRQLKETLTLAPYFMDASSPAEITFFVPGPDTTFIPQKVKIQRTRDLLTFGLYEFQLDGDKIVAARRSDSGWVKLPTPLAVPSGLLAALAKIPPPAVIAVVSAASFTEGPQAPGSIVSLFGSNFSGKDVSVTFDGIPAKLFYIGAGQINLQIPPELGARTSAQVVVTVDGNKSQAQTVALTPVNPAIFTPGIINQDYSLNSPSAPALVGSIVQIFLTGLTPPSDWKITAKLHDRQLDAPDYAGPAPGLIGIQQVNLTVPADLPAMTTDVLVCASTPSGDQRVCSPPVNITLSTP